MLPRQGLRRPSRAPARSAWSLIALLAIIQPQAAAGEETTQPSLPVVALNLALDGAILPPSSREAFERAIARVAATAGVTVCAPSQLSIADGELASECAGIEREARPRLWWKAAAETIERDGRPQRHFTLSLEVGRDSPAGPSKLVVVVETAELESDSEPPDNAAGEEAEIVLPALEEVQSWFEAVAQRPDLLPSAATASPPEAEVPPERAATPAEEVAGAAKVTAPAHEEVQFHVREAVVGGGFSEGPIGQLLIDADAVSFTQHGPSKLAWQIPWRYLVEIRKDSGEWDSPYPVLLVDRRGARHFVSRFSDREGFLPGDPILDAVAKARMNQTETRPEERK